MLLILEGNGVRGEESNGREWVWASWLMEVLLLDGRGEYNGGSGYWGGKGWLFGGCFGSMKIHRQCQAGGNQRIPGIFPEFRSAEVMPEGGVGQVLGSTLRILSRGLHGSIPAGKLP